ncbi:heavy-metal-associated domain-containing protein, partial [Streptomyces sp. NPDC055080]
MAATVSGTAEAGLAVGGVTCASCAARIEKNLNRMEGVTSTANYAAEKTKVACDADITVTDLIATVEATWPHFRRPRPD